MAIKLTAIANNEILQQCFYCLFQIFYLLTAAHQIVLPVDEEVFGQLLHIVQGKIPGVDAAGVEHAYPGQL